MHGGFHDRFFTELFHALNCSLWMMIRMSDVTDKARLPSRPLRSPAVWQFLLPPVGVFVLAVAIFSLSGFGMEQLVAEGRKALASGTTTVMSSRNFMHA